MPNEVIIETRSLRKEYETLIAVNNVNAMIPKGEIYGLIGPNGAGKTTLMRMIAGLLEPTSGSALINNVDVWMDNVDANAYMAFLPDFFSLYSRLKVWEYLDYFANAYKIKKSAVAPRIKEVLELVNLTDKGNAYSGTLSRGMKQRLGIAKCILHWPKLLILDEPASGLDPIARKELSDLLVTLKKSGMTIMVSSHILSELAGYCTYVGIMEHGFLVKSGSIKDILKTDRIAKKVVLQATSDLDKIREYIQNLPGISKVQITDTDTLEFEYAGSSQDLVKLNRQLVMNNMPVTGLSQKQEGIQEIFTEVTKREGDKLKKLATKDEEEL